MAGADGVETVGAGRAVAGAGAGSGVLRYGAVQLASKAAIPEKTPSNSGREGLVKMDSGKGQRSKRVNGFSGQAGGQKSRTAQAYCA